MKTLVILTHPNIETSKINKVWKNRLEQEDAITIHELYKEYPNKKINVEHEQKLIKEHDRIVYQFPFHWYNAPSLLKEWQDQVFSFGFSHGPNGDKLKGKEFMLAISAGGKEEAYEAGGYQNFTISELTKPYQALANFTGMKYLRNFVLYGTHTLTEEAIKNSADELAKILSR